MSVDLRDFFKPKKVVTSELNTKQGEIQDAILKSDQEPAIVDVLKEVSKLRGPGRTVLGASPIRDSNSNAVADRAIHSMEKLIRVHKLSIEARINEKLCVCMVSGTLCGLVQQVPVRVRRQDCISAHQSRASTRTRRWWSLARR